ncbi:hypothetical protein JAK50_17820 [Stenotrophomonas maltophilia]|uniref:hypothetical protein n=1 Tax=Stenotrophomonas maltophilia TaxID=40324 RepID=UPI001140A7CF|nr:hypothetical protein [Stenotrophomonas maltophilia]MCU1052364.1 hypothetical protein [Stenotrophomonas maltophilia]
MSQKIEDVLRVLAGIRGGYQPDKPGAIRRVRIQVVRQIAKQRGVECQTISDAYIRRLAPDIERTPAFDRLVEEWLASGSKMLQQILQNHASDRSDLVRISEFFSTAA